MGALSAQHGGHVCRHHAAPDTRQAFAAASDRLILRGQRRDEDGHIRGCRAGCY